jgi:polyphosphate kinase
VSDRNNPAKIGKSITKKNIKIPAEINPSDQCWYLNRELTWLSFNERVLHEAADVRNPLLARLKFLAVASSNLDGFFMKRIGGLMQQIGAGVRELSIDGRSPRQQVAECHQRISLFEAEREILWKVLRANLQAKGVVIAEYAGLSVKEKKFLRTRFLETIYPLLTPQSIDPAHPFPFISNLSLNLLVSLRYHGYAETSLARVKIPVSVETHRFLKVDSAHKYVTLDDVVCNNLDLLFPGMEVVNCFIFRVIRNANSVKGEEEAEDLVAMIETELKERRFAPVIRLEVANNMPPLLKGRLAAELEIEENTNVFETGAMLGMNDLIELARLDKSDEQFPPHHALDHPLLLTDRNIFHVIRENGLILLQHPFDSFSSSVERFLREAATDPQVRAIKMTLYRTKRDSRVVEALLDAARNGKQVAVVVELKASFDEAENIRLAETMNDAGVHVSYGIVGLKTYCKSILVVRQDSNGLRRYSHIGTGNYHAVKARYYCDLGLLTADEGIGRDLTELFNFLTTGMNPRRSYMKLLLAPHRLKKVLLEKIRREADLQKIHGGGHLVFKMNALEDPDIVKALYSASQAGVRIELIVRDACRLRPGVPGLSETISVLSVVGRFVEHSRIYYFRNGGNEEYYIGSADAMKRNLETRVEILCPVESPEAIRELRAIIDIYTGDKRSAWDMQPDGSYIQRIPSDQDLVVSSHCQLMAHAEKRVDLYRKSTKGKKIKAEPDHQSHF